MNKFHKNRAAHVTNQMFLFDNCLGIKELSQQAVLVFQTQVDLNLLDRKSIG